MKFILILVIIVAFSHCWTNDLLNECLEERDCRSKGDAVSQLSFEECFAQDESD